MWINERIRRAMSLGLVVVLAGVVTAACGDDDPVDPTTGDIFVTTTTTGDNPDADGYTVSLDGNVAGTIGVNDDLRISDLTPADYAVGLAEVAANCTVAGDNPRTVTVAAGQTMQVDFDIDCPGAPAAVELTAATEADAVTLDWTDSPLATSFRAELNGGTMDLEKTVGGDELTAQFTANDDGLEDGVTYTAVVYAVNDEGEAGSNEEDVTTNFFPWDEYFPTSLHETGAGKTAFYNTVPNRGFEERTGDPPVPYSDLACKGCHETASGLPPVNGRTCDRCHDTATPGLGDVVDTNWDDGVCMGCHSRQKLEKNLGYSDVHRDAGFDCMSCHTLGDVHGDGTEYDGLMDIGAIDVQCTDCHTLPIAGHPSDPHGGSVACASCHAQSAVTCNNCHFEAQVPPITGKYFLTPPAHNWLWLGNRLKRDGSGETEVYPVNYQSLEYQNATFVAFGFYTPHTIGTGRDCSSCHNNMGGTNPAIVQYNTDGFIDVAKWNAGTSNMDYPTGVVPMPADYLTSLRFDFATTADGGTTWTFLKAGADSIQVLPFWMTPLTTDQMSALGMTGP